MFFFCIIGQWTCCRCPTMCISINNCAWIFKQSMGTRNRVGIGLSFWTARKPKNRFLGIDSWAPLNTTSVKIKVLLERRIQTRLQNDEYRGPMPESTLTLWQSRLYPPVKDYEFGLIDITLTDLKLILTPKAIEICERKFWLSKFYIYCFSIESYSSLAFPYF